MFNPISTIIDLDREASIAGEFYEMMMLDVRNAFNSLRIIENDLSKRLLWYEMERGQKNILCQGSVLEPLL